MNRYEFVQRWGAIHDSLPAWNKKRMAMGVVILCLAKGQDVAFAKRCYLRVLATA